MRILAASLAVLMLMNSAHARTERPLDLSALPVSLQELILAQDKDAKTKLYSPAEADELIKRLHGDPQVQHAWVRVSGGAWKLDVDLLKKINNVYVSGARAISPSKAQEILNLTKDQPFDMSVIIDNVEKLRLAYRAEGVLNPNIDLETPPADKGNIDLIFKIDEGPQTLFGQWKVRSDNSTLNAKLEKMLAKKLSGPYTESKVREGRDLVIAELKSQQYIKAEVRPFETRFSADESRADVFVDIENPDSYVVDFIGNKELTTSTLENDILQLKTFTTANPNIVGEFTSKITEAYLQKGYARVEVRSEETSRAQPFAKRLTFQIDEGPQVKVDRLEFTGRITKSQDFYRDLFYLNASKTLNSNLYNKEDVETALKNFVLELQNNGYLLAKIVSTRTQFSKDKSRVNITINLDEGALTQIQGIEFIGNQKISGDELRRQLGLREGGPLKLNAIEQSIQIVKTYYQEKGYIEMKILNEKEDLVLYNEDNTRATLSFKILEGPQVHVASILTDGNTFTKDYVIYNELDFAVGDILTPSKIDESIARLQRAGHFASIEIKSLEENTAVENRTMIVRVTERNPGIFTVGVGATNERTLTLRGYTGIGYRNIYGTGRGLSFRAEGNYNVADIKYPESKFTISYLEPYLFDTRNRGRINVNRQKTVVDYDLRKVSEVNQVTYTIERDFTSHVAGAWDIWSLSTFNDFFIDPNKPRISQLDIALTTLKLDLDYRDNPFNPTNGNYTRFAYDYSSPKIGSSNVDEFYRATSSLTVYAPIRRWGMVWANQVRGGYLKSLGHGIDGGIPYDKVGFILGGRSTVRGFESGTQDVFPNNEQLFPNDPNARTTTNVYKLTTSATMGLIKSELRFPLWGDYLGGAVFYDGGMVVIDGLTFDDRYRDSAGLGVHINTPVGPVNLEYGWKLDRRSGESEGQFYFSVGTF